MHNYENCYLMIQFISLYDKYKSICHALLHNSEIRFLIIGLCYPIPNSESIFHWLELNVVYNYEKIELCNKSLSYFHLLTILNDILEKYQFHYIHNG